MERSSSPGERHSKRSRSRSNSLGLGERGIQIKKQKSSVTPSAAVSKPSTVEAKPKIQFLSKDQMKAKLAGNPQSSSSSKAKDKSGHGRSRSRNRHGKSRRSRSRSRSRSSSSGGRDKLTKKKIEKSLQDLAKAGVRGKKEDDFDVDDLDLPPPPTATANRKKWSLEDEEDSEDDIFIPELPEEEETEIDPLDAFMVQVVDKELKKLPPMKGLSNTISFTEVSVLNAKKKFGLFEPDEGHVITAATPAGRPKPPSKLNFCSSITSVGVPVTSTSPAEIRTPSVTSSSTAVAALISFSSTLPPLAPDFPVSLPPPPLPPLPPPVPFFSSGVAADAQQTSVTSPTAALPPPVIPAWVEETTMGVEKAAVKPPLVNRQVKLEGEEAEKPSSGSQKDAENPDDDEEDLFHRMFVEQLKAQVVEEDPHNLTADKKANGSPADHSEATGGEATQKTMRGELYFEGDEWEWGPEDEEIIRVAKELKQVDHQKLIEQGAYQTFRKSFFILPKELAKLSEDEVKAVRKELDSIKVKDTLNSCPPPVRKWEHCGLADAILDLLKKQNFPIPFAVQCQAIPAIMSGRDVLACASTGSGKTLGFLLPMIRHILDQPDLELPIGPIGLVLVPTRELATQIHGEAKKFGKAVQLRASTCYGGAPIADQIAELKRCPHILVATPGRMIDMLSANRGRVTCLTRTTYLVFDEADRMFDLGFGPQVMKIANNVRPDRQTVMFSATFPKQVAAAAKVLLINPVEVIVGGRSSASVNVKQFVELFDDENQKFLRLLQLLGEALEKGLTLVFVDTQTECDDLFMDLVTAGYSTSVCELHGGMDQFDREYTLHEFKQGQTKKVMIATSVAARGLDIHALSLVINFKCPNHYEDYVHRIGRTGRAGKKGTAYTFLLRDTDDRMALDLVNALKSSNNEVPSELQTRADAYWDKAKLGLVVYKRPSGFRGKGYKFNSDEAKKKHDAIRKQAKALGLGDEISDSSDDGIEDEHDIGSKAATRVAQAKAAATQSQAKEAISGLLTHNPKTMSTALAVVQAQSFAIQLAVHQAKVKTQEERGHFTAEVEINDYPQQARWKVTNKEAMGTFQETYGVVITTKGIFCKSGKAPQGERPLYLLIEGSSEVDVGGCKKEIQRTLDESTQELLARGVGTDQSAFGGARRVRVYGSKMRKR